LSDEPRSTTPPTTGGPIPPKRSAPWVLIAVLVRVGLAFVVIAIAVGVFAKLLADRPTIEPDDSTITPPIVDVVRVEARAVPRVWDGYGTARAMGSAVVPAQVAGRVAERPASVEAGEPIERGGLLVRLDDTDYLERVTAGEQAVAGLEADLAGLDVEAQRVQEQVTLADSERAAAQREYERAQEADRRGALSAGELDRKVSSVRAAERAVTALRQQLDLIPSRRASLRAKLAAERANLGVAREDLARTRIVSPIGGVLQSVEPEVGEWVGVGASVARVVDLSHLEIPLRLPASASASVAVGDPVALRTDGREQVRWQGTITRVAPEADAGARTITVFVEVRQEAGAPGVLLPGQFVVGRVSGRAGDPMLVVPRRAVEDDRVQVAVAAGGEIEAEHPGASVVTPMSVRVVRHAEGRFPGLDPRETEWAVVTGGGLEAGMSVIVSNLEQLRAGMVVEGHDRGAGERSGREPVTRDGGEP